MQFISSTPGLVLETQHFPPSVPGDLLVSLRANNHKFSLTFPTFGIYHIMIKTRFYIDYFNTTAPYVEYDLPERYHNIPHRVFLDITTGSSSAQLEFDTEGSDICQNLECLFCADAYQGWDCLTWYEQMAIILVLICFVCLAIIAIPLTLFVIGFILVSIAKCLLGTKNMSKQINFEEISNDISRLNPFKCCSKYFTGKVRTPANGVLYAAVVVMLISLVGGCDTGVSVPGVVSNCVQLDTMTQQCSVDYSLFLSLDALGSIACVTVVDSIASGTVLYTAQIEYLVNKVFYNPFIQYYTSSWTFGFQSRTRCPATEDCSLTDDSSCPYAASTSNRQMFGELSSQNLVSYPGLSRCDRGNVANNCFFANPTCCFSGYWFYPTGPIQGLYSLGLIDYQVILRITFDNGVDSGVVEIPLSPGVTQNLDSTTITLENYVPISNSLGSAFPKALISGNTVYPLVNEVVSAPSFPEVFKIGDIQSGSITSFTTQYTQLVYNHNIITYDGFDGNGAHYTAQGSGSANNLGSTLPMLYAGNLWDFTLENSPNVNQISSIYTNASFSNPIQLNIVVENGVVYRTVSFSHLDSSFIETSGCYNCQLCAQAVFNLGSDGQGCSASVTSLDSGIEILTKSVVIGSPSQHTISYCSSQQIGTATFKFSCGASETSSTFDYILSAPDITISDHYMYYYYGYIEPITGSSDFGLGLFDWLFDDHNIIFWMLMSAIAVVSLVLVLFCIVYCIFWIFTSLPALLLAGYAKKD